MEVVIADTPPIMENFIIFFADGSYNFFIPITCEVKTCFRSHMSYNHGSGAATEPACGDIQRQDISLH